MIRDYTETDMWPCIRLMQRAHAGCPWYRYGQMDGTGVVDEHNGKLRGYVRFHLGRPETHIRQLIVAPEWQGDGVVAFALLSEVVRRAIKHGSLGVEGFQADGTMMLSVLTRVGAQMTRGTRARFPLVDGVSETARQWRERCLGESA